VRAAVLGSPVAHSLSPALHRAAYRLLGLDWTYDAVEVDEAGLAGFLATIGPEWAGLSLTMPLKAAVLPLLDDVEPLARTVGAVNTVVLRDGRRFGSNTDVPGLSAALAERGLDAAALASLRRVVVLGSGATARSAVAALAGAREIVVVARRPEAFVAPGGASVLLVGWDRLAAELSAPLVVSTVPTGASEALAEAVPDEPGLLFDVVYDPWPTPLARRWLDGSGSVLGGLDLLVHQAALQVRAMTGSTVATDELLRVMRTAGRAELATR
jgi:shikimate dehydrogenase